MGWGRGCPKAPVSALQTASLSQTTSVVSHQGKTAPMWQPKHTPRLSSCEQTWLTLPPGPQSDPLAHRSPPNPEMCCNVVQVSEKVCALSAWRPSEPNIHHVKWSNHYCQFSIQTTSSHITVTAAAGETVWRLLRQGVGVGWESATTTTTTCAHMTLQGCATESAKRTTNGKCTMSFKCPITSTHTQ